jgi:hypothetical protein
MLKQIQNLPERTRVQILWVFIIIIGAALLAIWVYSTTKVVNRNDNPQDQQSAAVSEERSGQKYIEVEAVEHKGGNLLVYFKATNPTDNILVVSKPESIALKAGDKSLNPSSVVNRQNQSFQQKILSHSEAFGTAVFEDTAVQNVTLTFNNLSFETDDGTLFKQELQLDLQKLDKPL